MDGSRSRTVQPGEVEAAVNEIKARMPETYRSIQAKAGEIGREAYAMVRRGIGGQANTFWALEAGRVVGTPFDQGDIAADVALLMVRFGMRSCVIWGAAAVRPATEAAKHGAH